MKFVLDGMLGKLTRWLRMMGYDALYLNDAKDQDLVANAIQQKRILLTSDVALYRYAIARGAEAFLVKGRTEAERLAGLADRFELALSVDTTQSRCPTCGAVLNTASKEEVKGKVPETTFNVFDEFWACSNPDCGKVYWQGSHWENISAVLEKARKIQDKKCSQSGDQRKMAGTYSVDDGRFLVSLARSAITEYLSKRKVIEPPSDAPKHLLEKSGVFVTLNLTKPKRRLRGCIGYPLPTEPLVVATINAAIEAATGDPRFEPVQFSEFKNDIAVEVSVLTAPEELDAKKPVERPKEIEIGKHGLVVGRGPYRGLLLPQVAPEWDWNAEEFLSQCCLKAGLPPDSWLDEKTKVEKFHAVVFEEDEPNGEVHLKKL